MEKSKDIFDLDLFAPMFEEDVGNFEKELLPKDLVTRADEVSLKEAVKSSSERFDGMFGGRYGVEYFSGIS
jgi:hypothetical protein